MLNCCSPAGGMGADKNGIHIAFMFLPVCTTHCARDVEKDTLSKASMPFATMPKKTLAFTFFASSYYNIPQTDVEQGKHDKRPCG